MTSDPPRSLPTLDATQRSLGEETLDAIAKANGITREELDRRIRLVAAEERGRGWAPPPHWRNLGETA